MDARTEQDHLARRLWVAVEPVHAVVYFAPEVRAAMEDVGLRGFWRGYFANRAAPLGRVGAGVVTATFHGFHPGFVARAVPDVWERCGGPDRALEARLAGVDAALRSLVDLDLLTRVAEDVLPTLWGWLDRASPAGRTLFAANADLDRPDEPHLALWHAATLLREHRGDGHVAALVAHDLGPCEAHVLRTAVQGAPAASIQPHRGFDDDAWRAATGRLRSRGLLDSDGVHVPTVTDAGRRLHAAVEAATDAAALPTTVARTTLSPSDEDLAAEVDRVAAALAPVRAPLLDLLPPHDPIGLGGG